MLSLNVILCVVLSVIAQCSCAKILATIPIPSYSHQVAFRLFFKELAKRGHQVTLLTTDPMPEDIPNIRQIDLHGAYDVGKRYNMSETLSSTKDGVVTMLYKYMHYMEGAMEYELCHPEVQQLVNGDETFDLVIAEFIMTAPLALGHKLNCPVIGVVSLDGHAHAHASVGNPIHPIVNPDFNLHFFTNLSFKQRLYSVFYHIGFAIFINHMRTRKDRILKKCFGDDVPPIEAIEKNISMLFVNAHPIFYNVRSLGPATINIGGGTHIPQPKPLTSDLQMLLDNASQGVIYFSFGSNVKSNHISNATLQVFLDVLQGLPYQVLWKCDDDDIVTNSSKIQTAKWFPQLDILRHPNVKLFITQGGLQSMEEALVNRIPMVGIPFFGDQFNNVYRMAHRGFGLWLDGTNITKDNLNNTIAEVISNPKFKEKATEMSVFLTDQPMTGLEKAIWWTEYVIRHKGATNLRNPVLDVPLYQYFFLDILLFFVVVISTICYLMFIICKLLYKLIARINRKKEKQM